MRLLLDTNVLLWIITDADRIDSIRELILSDETEIFVSVVSCWEIAIKTTLGKLEFDVADVRSAVTASGFSELPIFGSHTEAVSDLPLLHRDPFDRMIVAQAISEPMQLVTGDRQLSAYPASITII